MNQNHDLPMPFDDYEIYGLRRLNAIPHQEQSPDAIVLCDCEEVDDEDAEFWRLFGHVCGQGLERIGDYQSRADAEKMYKRITGQSYRDRDRVKRFAKVVRQYTDDDAQTNLVDLLTDGMHWCRAKSVSFDESLQTAAQHFTAEDKE